jgi:hypothetical protein
LVWIAMYQDLLMAWHRRCGNINVSCLLVWFYGL